MKDHQLIVVGVFLCSDTFTRLNKKATTNEWQYRGT